MISYRLLAVNHCIVSVPAVTSVLRNCIRRASQMLNVLLRDDVILIRVPRDCLVVSFEEFVMVEEW